MDELEHSLVNNAVLSSLTYYWITQCCIELYFIWFIHILFKGCSYLFPGNLPTKDYRICICDWWGMYSWRNHKTRTPYSSGNDLQLQMSKNYLRVPPKKSEDLPLPSWWKCNVHLSISSVPFASKINDTFGDIHCFTYIW